MLNKTTRLPPATNGKDSGGSLWVLIDFVLQAGLWAVVLLSPAAVQAAGLCALLEAGGKGLGVSAEALSIASKCAGSVAVKVLCMTGG